MDDTSKRVIVLLSFIAIVVLSIILIRSSETTQPSETGAGETTQPSETDAGETTQPSEIETERTSPSPSQVVPGTNQPVNDCKLTGWVIGECDEKTGKQHDIRTGTGNCDGIPMSRDVDCCKTTPWVNPTGCVSGSRKFTRTVKNCPAEYKTVKFELCETIGEWKKLGTCGKDGKQAYEREVWNAPKGTPNIKHEPCCWKSSWYPTGSCGDDGMRTYKRDLVGSVCEGVSNTKRDTCCKAYAWTPKGSCVNGKQIYTRVLKNCPTLEPTMTRDCCVLGEWKKSGECKAGGQVYVRTTAGYCPEKPKTLKIEPCCTTGPWKDTGKCNGEYEEQFRIISKGCSSDVPKTQHVITTFCKDQEAARKLKEKKELDEAEKERLRALASERAKALAIKQQKIREEMEAAERQKQNLIKEAKNAQLKVQECTNRSWNGVVLVPGYVTRLTKDNELLSSTKHGDIKIDVTVDKTRISRYSGNTTPDYTTAKTVISYATYRVGTRGSKINTGYRAAKTYNGRLLINKGRLILMKYRTRYEQGPKKYQVVAAFPNPDKHAVALLSFDNKNSVFFIKNDGKRVYDLVDGKWIDNPNKC